METVSKNICRLIQKVYIFTVNEKELSPNFEYCKAE